MCCAIVVAGRVGQRAVMIGWGSSRPDHKQGAMWPGLGRGGFTGICALAPAISARRHLRSFMAFWDGPAG